MEVAAEVVAIGAEVAMTGAEMEVPSMVTVPLAHQEEEGLLEVVVVEEEEDHLALQMEEGPLEAVVVEDHLEVVEVALSGVDAHLEGIVKEVGIWRENNLVVLSPSPNGIWVDSHPSRRTSTRNLQSLWTDLSMK